jgi:hypothetical protein
MNAENGISDCEFIALLRAATERYLSAVDRWEAGYHKYYRMPGGAAERNDDLETEQRDYRERRRELEQLLPRVRRLCLKHNLRDPFFGLTRISLGTYAPQQRLDSAIGRGERQAVTDCLMQLDAASQEWACEPEPPVPDRADAGGRQSLLQRLVSFFY